MSKIKFYNTLPPEIEDVMRKDLALYEAKNGIDVNYTPFAYVIESDQNQPVAVLNAYTCFAEIYIFDLWVDQNHQKKGYGRELIEAVKLNFKNKGFNNINLVTNEFQAPQFYQKCGFELEFIRKNHKNSKLNKYFFIYFFNEKEQTQGLLVDSDPDAVYQSYNRIAEWFDQRRSRELFEKPYLNLIINKLQPTSEILDLGCGMGEPIGKYFYENNFKVTGVDASFKLLNMAKKRLPNATFIELDMRELSLNKKFHCIIAWHSFFHLPPNDQRSMFQIFESHIKPSGFLLFTTGPNASEEWSNNGGENLYHASLSQDEYSSLLKKHHFHVIKHKKEDPQCRGATVWLVQYQS